MKPRLGLRALLARIGLALLAGLLALIVIEGVSSLGLVLADLRRLDAVARRPHTEYDPLLGWISKPNQSLPDMYGPGKGLHTNSQRFRGTKDYGPIPPNTTRWVCIGDSFTFGNGVADDAAWCALLDADDEARETVNMGQGGYGLDQAYLWYTRDGVALEHDVLIAAIVTLDIQRMASDRFLDYPKPFLTVRNREIVQRNDPVPRLGFLERRLLRYRTALSGLGTMRAMKALFGDDEGAPAAPLDSDVTNATQAKLTINILRSLQASCDEHGRTFVLVLLPTSEDYRPSADTDSLRSFLQARAKTNGWIFLDLIPDLRRLNAAFVSQLFLLEDPPGVVGAKGHYNERGNRFIADTLLARMARDPRTAPLLGADATDAR